MSEVKLTAKQISALKWAAGTTGRHWQGVKWGSPARGTLSALLARSLVERVGVLSMDLWRLTPLGRSALAPDNQEARRG